MRPLFPRPGGKSWLARELVARIPPHEVWVEPFCGALGAFLARPEPSPFEVINDADGALINLLRQVQRHPAEMCSQVGWLPHARKGWQVAASCTARPPVLTEIEWAAETWRRLAWSFAGAGRSYGRTLKAPMLPVGQGGGLRGVEARLRALSARLSAVTIECGDWRAVVKAYAGPGVFIFCDPPYTSCADPGYGVWGEAEMVELAEALRASGAHWMVTANDAPEVRRAFAGCRLEEVWRPRSLSNTASSRGGVSKEKRGELIIRPGALSAP